MRLERFREYKTGQLVPIKTSGRDDWAFVPNPLPPAWTIPAELWPLIAEARGKVGRLDGIGRTLPDPQLLLRPLQRREALKSSSLEGTYITPRELLLLELESKEGGEPSSKRRADWLEVLNCYNALQTGHQAIRDGRRLDGALFTQLHDILLAGVRGKDKSPGQYRDLQVHVGADRRYTPPPPESVAECMANLERYCASPADSLDPLVRSYIVHCQFEAIHPFTDGNGRIGRLLISLGACLDLRMSMPWLYISDYFEEHRSEYIEKLFNVSCQGDWREWIEFCLIGTTQVADAAIRRCEELQAIRARFKSLIGRGSARLHVILDTLFSSPIVQIAVVAKSLGVSYHTAKSYVEKLVALGILAPIPDTYPKAYAASEVFRVAYE